MSDKLERKFPGKQGQEIFDALVSRIGDIATRHSLKIETDPTRLSGRVHRTGADVKFHVDGDQLTVHFDFSFLVPRPIRDRVKDELASRLDGLFPGNTVA